MPLRARSLSERTQSTLAQSFDDDIGRTMYSWIRFKQSNGTLDTDPHS